jgi:hypothetical protein
MIIGFNTQIMPEMAARTLCRSARLRTRFCRVLQKALESASGRSQGAGGGQEEGAQRVMGGQEDAHAPDVTNDAGAELQEPCANRGRGGRSPFRIPERQAPESLHERVSPSRQEDVRPVGEELVATGSGAEEVGLGFLDPVLGLSPLTVEFIAERAGRQIEVADNEPGIVALTAEFEPGDDSSRPIPAFGGIGEFMDGALLFLALGVLLFEFIFLGLDDLLLASILRNADEVTHVVAFAPANQPLTAETRIAPNDDAHIRPDGMIREAGSPLEEGFWERSG